MYICVLVEPEVDVVETEQRSLLGGLQVKCVDG